jgi:hypothetical protein
MKVIKQNLRCPNLRAAGRARGAEGVVAAANLDGHSGGQVDLGAVQGVGCLLKVGIIMSGEIQSFILLYFTLTAASAGAATAPWKRAARAMTAAKKAENCMLR